MINSNNVHRRGAIAMALVCTVAAATVQTAPAFASADAPEAS